MVVVAPLFGYKIDLLVSQLSQSSDEAAPLETEVTDPAYGGYQDTYNSGYEGYNNYASAGAARALQSPWSSWSWSSLLNRF